jgi:hypothetical protein
MNTIEMDTIKQLITIYENHKKNYISNRLDEKIEILEKKL